MALHQVLDDHLSAPAGPSTGGRKDISKVEWSWPSWCLNQEAGQLQVYVLDEETSTGAWVSGIAMTRVVDPSGKDAYLHVQYLWEEEEYVEDFSPPRVRRVGQLMTVEDMIRSGELSPQTEDSSIAFPSGAGYSAARAPPSGDALAEVILECISAEGIELPSLPPEQRAIALQVKHGSLYHKIGRQHQPEFFERLVTNKDALTSISRSHFELSLEAPAAVPKLRQLSKNQLLVDSRLVTWTLEAPIAVPDGTRLTFCDASNSDSRFLALRLTLRSRAVVDSAGQHPAVKATMQQQMLPVATQSQPKPMRPVAAVLECLRATGTDLARVPADVKAIPLEFDKPTDIGRTHQARVFEELLKAEPSWLSFISRTHCRVKFAKTPQGNALEVENFSGNVLFVDGQPLAKGDKKNITEGGILAFASAATGDDSKFLEFRLRRAKLAA